MGECRDISFGRKERVSSAAALGSLGETGLSSAIIAKYAVCCFSGADDDM